MGELREFDLNGEKVNYQYFQEINHQTQQQISRGVKESHCDSFYNNNIRYLYFSDLIISASSSFFQSGLVAVLFLQHRYVQVYQSFKRSPEQNNENNLFHLLPADILR